MISVGPPPVAGKGLLPHRSHHLEETVIAIRGGLEGRRDSHHRRTVAIRVGGATIVRRDPRRPPHRHEGQRGIRSQSLAVLLRPQIETRSTRESRRQSLAVLLRPQIETRSTRESRRQRTVGPETSVRPRHLPGAGHTIRGRPLRHKDAIGIIVLAQVTQTNMILVATKWSRRRSEGDETRRAPKRATGGVEENREKVGVPETDAN